MADDDTTTTQPDLHRGEKNLMLRLGIVAAAAALVGALIGGTATVGAVWWQTAKAEEQSVEAFRRDKLGDKYAELLSALQLMGDRMYNWSSCASFDSAALDNPRNQDDIQECKQNSAHGRDLGNRALQLKDDLSFASPAVVHFAWDTIAIYNGAYETMKEVIPNLGAVQPELKSQIERAKSGYSDRARRARLELIKELGLPTS